VFSHFSFFFADRSAIAHLRASCDEDGERKAPRGTGGRAVSMYVRNGEGETNTWMCDTGPGDGDEVDLD